MLSKWLVAFFGITVLLCSSAISMATGKEEVSPATLQQLQYIENSIDHTEEPCDNFYNYACGNWERQEFALGTTSSNHVFLKKNFLKAVEKMLVSEYPGMEHIRKENQSITDKVLAFYYSCKSSKKFRIFKELKPGNDIEWPLLDALNGKAEGNMENFDLFSFLGHLFSYGFDNFLLNRDVRRHTNGSISIKLDVPYEEYIEVTANDMLHIIGYRYREETFTMNSNEINETHKQWLTTYKEYSVDNSDTFSYHQVKLLYPGLAKYLDLMLPNQLKDDDVVEIINIKYIEFLTEKVWQPQEIRKLYNYAMVFLFKYLAPNFTLKCVDIVQTTLHLAINYMYRQHYYSAEAKAAFMDLKEKIYKYLFELVNENYLQFNAEQLKAVKDKLDRIYLNIGNVPDIVDDIMLEEFYRHMPAFDVNNFSKNVLWSVRQRFWESINCLDNMECLEDLDHGTYNVLENDLVIMSMASMAPPMYDWTFDPIFAVSLMGVFIGHEYGHSIDTGSLMDSDLYGTMHEEFKNHSRINASMECTNQQYSTDYLRQMQVDLVGARAAFRVYSNEYNIQPSFTKIPWQQLFFLNYAQFFCSWKDWDDELTEQTARTNHVAMNMNGFAEAFNCPAGSNMNPVKKCLLY